MSHAFIPADRPLTPATPTNVLVTGAAGRIGRAFAQAWHQRYTLTLLDREPEALAPLAEWGRTVTADLADADALRHAAAGQDTVVHLAADPRIDADWQSLLPNNIVGTYNLLHAALAAGCRRVVLASSVHATGGYPAGVQVRPDDPVSPGNLYGVSKCFGEALGRYMATRQGLSVIAVRIGAFQPVDAARRPEGVKMANVFVSPRDLTQLLSLCIEDRSLQFGIVYGLSGNRFNLADLTEACRRLGYAPQDDLTRLNPALKDLNLPQ